MSAPAVALVAIAVTGTTAAAQAGVTADSPPDPIATHAGENANLVSLERRRGLTGTASAGPSFTLGAGNGNGGAVSLRIGQVANPRTVLSFELDASAQLHRVGMEVIANNITSLLVGAQYWVGPSLWVRAAGGLGVYACNKCEGRLTDERRTGPAGAVGIGLDLARFRGLVLGLEISSINQLNRNGMLSTNALGLGLSFE